MLVVDILSRYAIDKGMTLLEETGQAAVHAASQLWELALRRLKADPADARNAQRFEENPEGYRTPIADALADKAKSDPDFAAQLSALLQEYQRAASANASAVQMGSGVVATQGGIAAGEGGVAVGGNVGGGITISNVHSTYKPGGIAP
jgi:hypothetical protein